MKKYIVLLWGCILLGCMEHTLCPYHEHPHGGIVQPEIIWDYQQWNFAETFSELTYQYYGEQFFEYEEQEVHRVEAGVYQSLVHTKGKNALFRYEEGIEEAVVYTEVEGGLTRQPGFVFLDYQPFSIQADETVSLSYYPVPLIKVLRLQVNVLGLDYPDHIIGMEGYLSGCSTSLTMVSRERAKGSGTIPFTFQRPGVYETLFTAQVTTFGISPYEQSFIELELSLYDGGVIRSSFDLTSYFDRAEFEQAEVIDCILRVDIPRLGIDNIITIDKWEEGSWENVYLE